MQRKITVCNRLCEKDKCPHHTAKIPNFYNPLFIKYTNFEGAEECLKRKEVKKNGVCNKT